MIDLVSLAANNLWIAACLPEARRFRSAQTRLEETQARLLGHYLDLNRDTEYGRRWGFARIKGVESFQRAVPLTTYDDYAEAVGRIGRGERCVLTAEPVLMFEPSSGSTAPSKLIPYTPMLKAEFQRAIAVWVYELYAHYPQLLRGKAYWSITPLVEGRRVTPGGIPIGFEQDSDYLGAANKHLVEAAMAVPNLVNRVQDVASFRYTTLRFLLDCPELRLISVWNPTFLSLLLAPLSGWWERLLQDITEGTLSPPSDLDPELRRSLGGRLHRNPGRARALSRIGPNDFRAIWPHLGLISCWADGPAARHAQYLSEELLPGITIQGKGLLATEAFVSFPLPGGSGSVLAATSHFFEFLPIEESFDAEHDRPLLAHQLESGRIYAVVVTTGGGFYRYQLGDLVQLTGHVGQLPRIWFLGKADRISDRFGEKLDERFVANVLDRIFERRAFSPRFAMMTPDGDAEGTHYTLYLELGPEQRIPPPLLSLEQELDDELAQNFHYAYCRKLGQLGGARVAMLSGGGMEVYMQACQARGQRLGNIKPTALHAATDWRGWFKEKLL